MITDDKSLFYSKAITRSRRIQARKRLFSIEPFIHYKNKILSDFFTQDVVVEVVIFRTIEDGLFRGCSRMERGGGKKAPLPKIYHTYPTMMKLGTVITYPK